ncbi:MAG: DUF1311 domain-containing protein [Phycisphaerae bacterium]|nr:DUF1311 domain-containing protein [Phycisphaerae bacterium]
MTRLYIISITIALAIGCAGGYWLGMSSRHSEQSLPATTHTQSTTHTSESKSDNVSLLEQTEELHPIDKMVADVVNEYGACTATALVYAKAQGLWDEEMNTSYLKLMKEFPPELQMQLRLTQRAWIKFRDQQYKLLRMFYTQYHPTGTMWVSEKAYGRMIITKRRASDFAGMDWSIHYCP